jgi:hypothetical protein
LPLTTARGADERVSLNDRETTPCTWRGSLGRASVYQAQPATEASVEVVILLRLGSLEHPVTVFTYSNAFDFACGFQLSITV